MLTANKLAAVEVNQTEARRLQQTTRHLVPPTNSGFSAFHCARRLRVFERDIRRFGTAMIRPYSW
jgi:hypothetical protein